MRAWISITFLLWASSNYGQIAFTSFENEVSSANATYASTNSTNLPLGDTIALGNTDDDSDTVILNSTISSTNAGDWGFSTTFTNTRDGSGISDGDFIGVTDFGGDPLGYNGRDGAQAFQISDPDGLLEVTFDAIDISAFTSVSFSLDYAINDDGYESDDSFQIWYTIDGGSRNLVVDLGETGLENASDTDYITASASGISGNSLVIGFNMDSNSGGESAAVDRLNVIPEPEFYAGLLGLVALGVAIYRRRRA